MIRFVAFYERRYLLAVVLLVALILVVLSAFVLLVVLHDGTPPFAKELQVYFCQ